MAQIFHPSYQHVLAKVSIFGALFAVGRRALRAGGGEPLAVGHAGRRGARAAGAVQPQASRRRARHRLPLLPHLGGDVGERRLPADADVHELPLADLGQSPTLEPVRASWQTGESIEWTKVYDLPDFVYFNHSIHVAKGIGCVSCHGRVDQMNLTWQEPSLHMEWCLDCHRNPGTQRAAALRGLQHGVAAAGRPAQPRRRADRRAPTSTAATTAPCATAERGVPRRCAWPTSTSARQRQRHDARAGAAVRKPRTPLDLPALRARLARATGQGLLAQPRGARRHAGVRRVPAGGVSRSRRRSCSIRSARRTFLKLMGASLALAGVSACTRQPTEKIFPYVQAPEQIVPGKPLYFATAMPLGGFATGLLVESHMGRPTKVEGNPEHPASLGATDVFCAGVGARPLRSRPLAGDPPRRRRPDLGELHRRARRR